MKILVTSNALNSLVAASAVFFGTAYLAYREGDPGAPSKQELQSIQRALKEAIALLGLEGPTLQKLIDIEI